MLDLNERLLAFVFDARRRAEARAAVAAARLRRGDRRASAPTGPTCGSGSSSTELTDLLAATEFKVFRGVIESGGVVKGLNAGARDVPRSVLDGLIGRAQELGAKGLVWAFREGDGWRSPTAKFLSDAELAALNERLAAEEGDLLLVVADRPEVADAVLGQLRLDLAERFELIDPAAEAFCWVVDWPLFGWNGDEERWDPLHHPFTAPDGSFDPAKPGEARALAYDVVWNGQEMGGGSIRISDPELQQQVLEAIGIAPEEARRALRLPARGAALRRAAARRDRLRARPDRPAAPARGLDPRRDRLPEGGVRRRPAHRRAGAGRRGAAARTRARAARQAPGLNRPRRTGERQLPQAIQRLSRPSGVMTVSSATAVANFRQGSSLCASRPNCEPTQLPWESSFGSALVVAPADTHLFTSGSQAGR